MYIISIQYRNIYIYICITIHICIYTYIIIKPENLHRLPHCPGEKDGDTWGHRAKACQLT